MSEDLRARLKDLESRAREADSAAEQAENQLADLPYNATADEKSESLRKARYFKRESEALNRELKRVKSQIDSIAYATLIRSILERIERAISILMTIAVLGGSLAVSCASVSEVSARIQARGRIDSIERDIMRGVLHPEDPIRSSLELDKLRSRSDASVTAAAREHLASLMLYGGPLTAADIADVVQRVTFGRMGPAPQDVEFGEKDSITLRQLGKLNWFERVLIGQQRNDFLLAIMVIACAVIGSIVVGLRSGNALFEPVRFLLGLASGFIVFISLRGGRAIFMMEVSGEPPVFNPHSMAFSGLLVGLFSEKAYLLLSTLVDDLFGRVRNAFKPGESPTATNAGGASGSEHKPKIAVAAGRAVSAAEGRDAAPPGVDPAGASSAIQEELPKTNGSHGTAHPPQTGLESESRSEGAANPNS
jgi:hypothetical protein